MTLMNARRPPVSVSRPRVRTASFSTRAAATGEGIEAEGQDCIVQHTCCSQIVRVLARDGVGGSPVQQLVAEDLSGCVENRLTRDVRALAGVEIGFHRPFVMFCDALRIG